MDTSTVNTLITTLTGVVTWFLGLYFGKKDASVPSIKRIREKQLSNLYTPLELLLNFDQCQDSVAALEDVKKILAQNLELAPPGIINEFEKAARDKSPNLRNLQIAVSSFYNWTKKYLGYPYDRSKIVAEFTPMLQRNQLVQKIASNLFITVFSVNVGLFLSQISLQSNQRSKLALQISGVILIIGLLVIKEYIFQPRER